jgi:glycine cleavage system H protein
VLEINEALESEPEKVNSSPYEDAWLVKLKLSSPAELGQLMSEDDYKNIVG